MFTFHEKNWHGSQMDMLLHLNYEKPHTLGQTAKAWNIKVGVSKAEGGSTCSYAFESGDFSPGNWDWESLNYCEQDGDVGLQPGVVEIQTRKLSVTWEIWFQEGW